MHLDLPWLLPMEAWMYHIAYSALLGYGKDIRTLYFLLELNDHQQSSGALYKLSWTRKKYWPPLIPFCGLQAGFFLLQHTHLWAKHLDRLYNMFASGKLKVILSFGSIISNTFLFFFFKLR